MKKYFALMAIAGLFFACTEPEEESTDTTTEGDETPALAVSIDAASYLLGDTITATISATNDDVCTRSNITLSFQCIDINAGSYDTSMFSSFPESAILKSTETEIEVEFVLSEAIESAYSLRIVTSAEGCTISGANQNFTVGLAYDVTLALEGVEGGVVSNGDVVNVSASVAVAPSADLTLALTYSDEALVAEDAPATLVIKAGEVSGTSEDIVIVAADAASDLTISAESNHNHYAVANSVSCTVNAAASAKGSKLLDETWVYDDPSAAFYSSNISGSYVDKAPSYKSTDMLVAKGDAHPNADLAAEGWVFQGAYEFHKVAGWSYPCTQNDTYGTYCLQDTPPQNGWAAQNTTTVEEYCWILNNKYTNVTDDGYVRLWAAYDQGSAQANGDREDNTRYIGASALYSLKSSNSTLQRWTEITVGNRVEIRARLGGNRQGFNYALWLMGNSNLGSVTWPDCGEIDIMENPVFVSSPEGTRNQVWQTIHYGDSDTNPSPTTGALTINAEEWNIYWVEIVDENTIKLGINGQTNKTITSSDSSAAWSFNTTVNPYGYHLLITPGVASSWAGVTTSAYTEAQIDAAKWADSSFTGISYEDSKTSDLTPHMDIDWIRIYANDNFSTYYSAYNINGNGNANFY